MSPITHSVINTMIDGIFIRLCAGSALSITSYQYWGIEGLQWMLTALAVMSIFSMWLGVKSLKRLTR